MYICRHLWPNYNCSTNRGCKTQVITVWFKLLICQQQQLSKPRHTIYWTFKQFYLGQNLTILHHCYRSHFMHFNAGLTLICRHISTTACLLFIPIPYLDFHLFSTIAIPLNHHRWSLQTGFTNNRKIHQCSPFTVLLQHFRTLRVNFSYKPHKQLVLYIVNTFFVISIVFCFM